MIRRAGTCGTAACGAIRVEGPTHPFMDNVQLMRNRQHVFDIISTGMGHYRNLFIANNTGGTAFYGATVRKKKKTERKTKKKH